MGVAVMVREGRRRRRENVRRGGMIDVFLLFSVEGIGSLLLRWN